MSKLKLILAVLACFMPTFALAGGDVKLLNLEVINNGWGYAALALFIISYLLVMVEEFTHLRKSKPVLLVAGLIWMIIAYIAKQKGMSAEAEVAIRHNLLEYAELFLFLLVAMTYVAAMEDRRVFEALRVYLVKKGFGFRQLFWITGILAFFISPIADNLTTALIMCAVIMAVGGSNKKFVALGCINIVVAANAGGAFSPFGDITTLMVWQKGIFPVQDFLTLFVPAVVNFVVPALCMHFAVPKVQPAPINETTTMGVGAKRCVFLFIATIATAILFHNYFHLPPVIGMLTGLSYLALLGFFIKNSSRTKDIEDVLSFDVFKKIERAEWDTLLFFYGVILSVGGLATLGYLNYVSHIMYDTWGANLAAGFTETPANIMVGILSAIVDNIPVMYAVLTMNPPMNEGQWLLVTLTAGVGGSMLSIGSAAGVALMGQAKGVYTFFSHLKWTWAIALGYVASIACHIWLNHHEFLKEVHVF